MPVIDKILDAFVGLVLAFATVVDLITPVLDFFIDIFGKVAGLISEHSETINKVVEAIGAVSIVVWGLISGVLDGAWKFIEPILGWLIDKLGWGAEKITSVMNSVGKWDLGGKVSHMFSPFEWKMLGGDGYTNDKKRMVVMLQAYSMYLLIDIRQFFIVENKFLQDKRLIDIELEKKIVKVLM